QRRSWPAWRGAGACGQGTRGAAVTTRHDRGQPGTAGRTFDTVPPARAGEQESLRKVVRDFAEREIAPHAERWDADHTFPTDVVRKMGDLGLFGIPFPGG